MNLHLLAALPDLPGMAKPASPCLEYDTTPDLFRENLLQESLEIGDAVKRNGGVLPLLPGPKLGVLPDEDFVRHYAVSN